MKKLALVAILLLPLSLTACAGGTGYGDTGSSNTSTDSVKTPNDSSDSNVYNDGDTNNGTEHWVFIQTMPDHRRVWCVATNSSNQSGGVTCDFDHPITSTTR